jgi:hypothetical protein
MQAAYDTLIILNVTAPFARPARSGVFARGRWMNPLRESYKAETVHQMALASPKQIEELFE